MTKEGREVKKVDTTGFRIAGQLVSDAMKGHALLPAWMDISIQSIQRHLHRTDVLPLHSCDQGSDFSNIHRHQFY